MEVLSWVGAIAPIVVLFLLMSVFHVRTQRAALLGIVCAAAAALLVGQSAVSIVGMDLLKGAYSAFNILIVIWPAVFLYEMLEHGGVFAQIRAMLQAQTQDTMMLVLLIAWVFSSFLQGITGFGVPVAVCAPILIAIGVRPLWSVMLTLLGHAWANTYGTFALGWDALITQSETTAVWQTKLYAGFFLWGIDLIGGLLICCFLARGRGVRHMLPFVLLISTVHGGGQLLVSFFNSTIAAFLPTTIALVVAFLVLRCGAYTKPWKVESKALDAAVAAQPAGTPPPAGKVAESVFPFLLLAGISVVVLLIPPVHDVLNVPVWQLSFPETVTGRGFTVAATDSFGAIHPLTHAGFVLLLTCVITYAVYWKRGLLHRQFSAVGRATLQKIVPTSLGILFLVMMAQVLKGSGLMELIAEGLTQVTGPFYTAAVPLLGLLGAFVTSSNTSSNILLGSFQHTAAGMIAANEAVVLAAQTAGGAIGTVVGPSTILLGTTTAGCKGKEGEVLKFMLPIVLVEAVVTGDLSYLLAY